jgi:TPR repeat protein
VPDRKINQGSGIPMNKSLAAHYSKCSANQGDARAQFCYAVMLDHGEHIPMNQPLAAHYYKFLADHGHAQGQFTYGLMLHRGESIPMNRSLAAHYFKLSADQGNIGCKKNSHPPRFCHGIKNSIIFECHSV